MLLIDARPLGLGQVSIDSRTLKSARLKTNILVSNTIIHRSGLDPDSLNFAFATSFNDAFELC